MKPLTTRFHSSQVLFQKLHKHPDFPKNHPLNTEKCPSRSFFFFWVVWDLSMEKGSMWGFGAVPCPCRDISQGCRWGWWRGRRPAAEITSSHPEATHDPNELGKTREREHKRACCQEQTRDRRLLRAGARRPAGVSALVFLEIRQGNEISGSLVPISTH